ncbi:MAG: hypothetical protein A3H61_04250 [Candidatus Jacksonbacteria bacterium RIFCSPLOWO2_02_FULL_44_20]|uniref:Nudix hydrolase domain-containing protein n=1 Tax=Candidatus Jacksonbacteria bacterium RIFCSPLOWO2_02_FULL_44_20 TaxID=1798460 RepID=A0A1G2ADL5_9BACT|nr:MAG: hypothetical protein A3H61_04250 [Candidatus Jacksonbacteria bacterium RIFCSPLOWO2_02_FULL_44_20]HCA67229.1 hypothetical protein [Candidatus Jacksonbacteria bacterium]HCE87230.1 hypothetical protein [Candidatus Jacksonbacteria bacterium]
MWENFLCGNMTVKNYDNTIETVVGALVVSREGRLLLVTGPKWKGRYTIVGGHIEYGERIKETVRRELQEEIGVVPERIEFLCVNDEVFPSWFHRKAHFIFLNFVAWVEDISQIKLCEREFTDHKWFTAKDALALPETALVSSVRPVIEAYRKKYGS